MEDKSALLNQLRIERGGGPARPARWGLWLAILAGSALIAAAVWFWTRPAGVPVHVATAESIAGGSPAAAPSSILDASGYVVARRQATVASKITAKMVELDIEEGDRVKEGQVIARLDDTNLRAALNAARAQIDYARSGLAETEVNLKNAQRDYDRQRSLLGGHFVSQSAVDNAETSTDALSAQLATQRSNIAVAQRNIDVAQRNLDDTVVRAPFAGVVTVKAAQPGEIVSPISAGGGFTRTGIGTIVDMDSLEIQVDVNENFINLVQPDQKVTARLNAYPDWQIPGHVIAVIPTADRSKGTVTVRIALEQKDPRILPEMGVRVAFLGGPTAAGSAAGGAAGAGGGDAPGQGVSLPAHAVQASGATGVVFIVHDSTVERRAVKLGQVLGDRIVVSAGVTAGERAAVGDFAKLKDGAEIRIEP